MTLWIQISAVLSGNHSPCDSVNSDLMTRHPSIASQLERRKLLHLNSVQTAAKRRMVFHLIMMLLWTLCFVESFLRSCRKSGKLLSVRDNAFQGSLIDNYLLVYCVLLYLRKVFWFVSTEFTTASAENESPSISVLITAVAVTLSLSVILVSC